MKDHTRDIEKGSTPRFYIYAKKYCPRRSLESTRLYNYLCVNGLQPTNRLQEADFIFVYTCGGFALDEEFSILTIRKTLKDKSASAQIIVTGCLPKIDPEALNSFHDLRIMLPSDLCILDKLINAKVPYVDFPTSSIVRGIHDLYHGSNYNRVKRKIGLNQELLKTGSSYFKTNILHHPFNMVASSKTYKIIIAEGCLGQCSYCAIKNAMPKFHSFSHQVILEKFNQGLADGYKDFALIAGDIGCYGFDIETNLPTLLNELFSVEGEYKFVLVDLNPRWLETYYQELVSVLRLNSPKVSRIIIPIQSGSNKILKMMSRNYDAVKVKEYLKDLSKNVPNVLIDTHILVGFPGETETDFQESINFVKEVGFSNVEIYKYEDRPETLAKNFPAKVPFQVINERAKLLKKELRYIRKTKTGQKG